VGCRDADGSWHSPKTYQKLPDFTPRGRKGVAAPSQGVFRCKYAGVLKDILNIDIAVMAGLRDVAQNPEGTYVREGPEWWGRRVKRAAELWEKG
jgi:hypothetical protein